MYFINFTYSSNSLCLCHHQAAGVMSVYLFMKRYTAEEMYRPHPGFYRPRLSNCSDYSGQFLHPDARARGRSPSDISSVASLQMNSNYPALLKCPDYDQMSSSPCWDSKYTLVISEKERALQLILKDAVPRNGFETGDHVCLDVIYLSLRAFSTNAVFSEFNTSVDGIMLFAVHRTDVQQIVVISAFFLKVWVLF